MLLVYVFLACVFYLFSFVFILLLSFCKDKYKNSLKARFFLYKNPKLKDCDIHFHACSFGEINAIKNLVLSLSKKYSVNITTITQTGFDNAKKISSNVAFLPFEILLPLWLFKSKVLVIFEAELWLLLVCLAKKNGSKIILLNARISDKSVKKYQKFAFFYKKIFSYIDEVYAQSDIDKQRLESLGAKNVKVCGNLKLGNKPNINKLDKPDKKLCIIASSHENEEEKILNGIFVNDYFKDYVVVVAPRHPERFESVYKTILSYKKNTLKYSEDDKGYLKSDIFLLDTLGKLNDFYAISDVVFMCGSFVDKIGGHNALEPAFFESKIISGRYIFNQKELYKYVDGICFCDIDEIKNINPKNISKSKIISKQSSFDEKEITKYMEKS